MARGLRGYYGEPVYLCGSALLDCNADPRDWDVRIGLRDADFKRRYGNPDEFRKNQSSGNWTRVNWRWSYDCVKQSKDSYNRTQLNVDLQTQTWRTWRAYRHMPRFQLA